MTEIKSQDDIIREFISLGTGIKVITKEITGEDLMKHVREDGKKSPVDVIAMTSNYRIGYEIWYSTPAVSNIIHKINLRRKNRKDITHWVLILPDKYALDHGSEFSIENIYIVSWWDTESGRQIKFSLLKAFLQNMN